MPRRVLHISLVVLALAVWGSVAYRFASLSRDDAPPVARMRAAITRGEARAFVPRSDYADPFFYGTGKVAPQATVALSPRPLESPDLVPPPAEGGFYGPPPRRPEALPYRLTGIMGAVAILQTPEGRTLLVRKSDWLGDTEVVDVTRAGITLRTGSTTHELSLTAQ